MLTDMVNYYLNRSIESDIYTHLSACDRNFVRALVKRVTIKDYSTKIYNKAMRFEAWVNDTLVGLVAAYCNDQTKRIAYITSVTVLSEWQGKGIALELMKRCIEHARKLGMYCIRLEVAWGNAPAIRLYEKCGFAITDNGDSLVAMNMDFDQGGRNAK